MEITYVKGLCVVVQENNEVSKLLLVCNHRLNYDLDWMLCLYSYATNIFMHNLHELELREIIDQINYNINLKLVGAGRETRTLTLLPEPDFESGASTSSATPAHVCAV